MAMERSTYYITSVVLLAFSVAYVASYWIGSKRNRFLMSNFGLSLYMTLILLICVICMLRYLIPRQTNSWKMHQDGRQTTHAHRKKLTVISCVAKSGLIVFLLGAVVFDCISTLGLLDCMDVFLNHHCYQKERIMTAINKITKMIFMGVQATFLISEGDVFLKYGRSNTGRNVYIVNSIVNFTFVIFCALQEIKSADKGRHYLYCESPTLPVNASTAELANFKHQYDCINDRTRFDSAAISMSKYLYPFHSEFCTMATTLNLILWKLLSSDKSAKNDTRSARNCRRRRRRRSLRIHPRGSITSPIVREAPPDRDAVTSLERRPLLENEETATENEENDSDIETSLSIDRIPKRNVAFQDDTRGDSPDIEQSTTTRNEQVGGSEGYGSMDGNHTAGSPRGPPASESQEAGGSFLCCRGQCRECLDPRPRHIYGPDNGCGFISFAGFALLCVDTIMYMLLQSKGMRKTLFTPLYVISTVKIILMLIMTIFLAEICRRKLQIGPRAQQTLSVGSIVLIISAFVIFMFRVLEGLASVDLIVHPPNSTNMDKHFIAEHQFTLRVQNIFDIFDALLYIAQAAIQTNLVLRIHWIMKRSWFDDAISSSTAMQFTSFLTAANFSQWIVGTVVELKSPEVNFSQVLYYGNPTWKVVVYMLCPFVIYYRFHCTMALAEYMLWRREVKNAGQRGTRREDFVSHLGTFAYY